MEAVQIKDDAPYGSLQFLDNKEAVFKTHQLKIGCCSIGTSISAIIQLKAPTNRLLKNIHCSVNVDENGIATLVNKTNLCPVKINKSSIYREQVLQHGDILDIVETKLRYVNPNLPVKTTSKFLNQKKRFGLTGNPVPLKFTRTPSKPMRTRIETPSSSNVLPERTLQEPAQTSVKPPSTPSSSLQTQILQSVQTTSSRTTPKSVDKTKLPVFIRSVSKPTKASCARKLLSSNSSSSDEKKADPSFARTSFITSHRKLTADVDFEQLDSDSVGELLLREETPGPAQTSAKPPSTPSSSLQTQIVQSVQKMTSRTTPKSVDKTKLPVSSRSVNKPAKASCSRRLISSNSSSSDEKKADPSLATTSFITSRRRLTVDVENERDFEQLDSDSVGKRLLHEETPPFFKEDTLPLPEEVETVGLSPNGFSRITMLSDISEEPTPVAGQKRKLQVSAGFTPSSKRSCHSRKSFSDDSLDSFATLPNDEGKTGDNSPYYSANSIIAVTPSTIGRHKLDEVPNQEDLHNSSFNSSVSESPAFSDLDSNVDVEFAERDLIEFNLTTFNTRPSIVISDVDLLEAGPSNSVSYVDEVNLEEPETLKSDDEQEAQKLQKIEANNQLISKPPRKSTSILNKPTNLTNVSGVKNLFETPKIIIISEKHSTDATIVKELLITPEVVEVRNDLTNIGVEQLLKTPAPLTYSHEDSTNIVQPEIKMECDLEDISTSILNKTKTNDLTNVSGVKNLFETPKMIIISEKHLTDATIVKELLITPEVVEVRNDLPNIGVEQLLKTPALLTYSHEDSTNMMQPEIKMECDLEDISTSILNKTITSNDLTNVSGVKNLFETPKMMIISEKHPTDATRVKELLITPEVVNVRNDLTNIGAEQLLETPAPQTYSHEDSSNMVQPEIKIECDLEDISTSILNTTKTSNDLTNVSGVKNLFETLKMMIISEKHPTDATRVKELLITPEVVNVRNDLTNIGAEQLLETPAPQTYSHEDSSNMVQPEIKMECDLEDISTSILNTTKTSNDLTNVSGVKNLFETLKMMIISEKHPTDATRVKELLITPEVVNVRNDLTNIGAEQLLETPAPQTYSHEDSSNMVQPEIKIECDLEDISTSILNTTKTSNDLTNVSGVKNLFETPKMMIISEKHPTDATRVKELLITPEVVNVRNDLTNIGAEQLLETPAPQTYSHEDSSNMVQPEIKIECDLEDISTSILNTTKTSNDLTNVSGVKNLFETPKMMIISEKHPTDATRVKELLITPEVVNVRNDLTNIGAEQLLETPAPQTYSHEDSSNMVQPEIKIECDLEDISTSILNTTKTSNDLTNVSGVKNLFETPKMMIISEKHPTDATRVKELLITPEVVNVRNDLTNIGAEQLLETPAPQTYSHEDSSNMVQPEIKIECDLEDISTSILNTTKTSNDLTNVSGVKNLFETPKMMIISEKHPTDATRVKELLITPEVMNVRNDLTNIGAEQLLETPAPQTYSHEDSSNMVQPEIKIECDLEDISTSILNTTKTSNDLTNVSGVKNLFETPKMMIISEKHPTDATRVKELLITPEVVNVRNDLTNIGAEQLLETPAPQTYSHEDSTNMLQPEIIMECDLEDISTSILNKTKTSNDLTNVSGVKNLIETPKMMIISEKHPTDATRVKELLITPEVVVVRNDLTNIGAEQLLETPAPQTYSHEDSTNMVQPEIIIECDLENISTESPTICRSRSLSVSEMEPPIIEKSPHNDCSNLKGIKELLTTPAAKKTPIDDVLEHSRLEQLMRTPGPSDSPQLDLIDEEKSVELLETSSNDLIEVEDSPETDADISGSIQFTNSPVVQDLPRNDLTPYLELVSLVDRPNKESDQFNESSELDSSKSTISNPSLKGSTDDHQSEELDSSDSSVIKLDKLPNLNESFDMLMEKRPPRTYRGKSLSPAKSAIQFSPRSAQNANSIVSEWLRNRDFSSSSSSQSEESVTALDQVPDLCSNSPLSHSSAFIEEDVEDFCAVEASPPSVKKNSLLRSRAQSTIEQGCRGSTSIPKNLILKRSVSNIHLSQHKIKKMVKAKSSVDLRDHSRPHSEEYDVTLEKKKEQLVKQAPRMAKNTSAVNLLSLNDLNATKSGSKKRKTSKAGLLYDASKDEEINESHKRKEMSTTVIKSLEVPDGSSSTEPAAKRRKILNTSQKDILQPCDDDNTGKDGSSGGNTTASKSPRKKISLGRPKKRVRKTTNEPENAENVANWPRLLRSTSRMQLQSATTEKTKAEEDDAPAPKTERKKKAAPKGQKIIAPGKEVALPQKPRQADNNDEPASKKRSHKKVAPEKEVAIPQVPRLAENVDEPVPKKRSHKKVAPEKEVAIPQTTRQAENDNEPTPKKTSHKKVAPKKRAQKKVVPEKEVAVPQTTRQVENGEESAVKKRSYKKVAPKKRAQKKVSPEKEVAFPQTTRQAENGDESALKKRSHKKVAPKKRAQKKVAPEKEVAVPQIIEQVEKDDEPALKKRSFKKVAPKRRAQKKVAPEKEVAVPQVSWSEPTSPTKNSTQPKNEINAHHKTSHGTPDTEKLYVRSLRTRNVEKLQIIEQVEKDDEPALKKRSFKKVAPKRRAQKKVAPEKEVAVPQVSWSEPTSPTKNSTQPKNEINAHHKTSHGTPDTEKLYVRSLRTRNVEKLQIIEQVEKDDEPALKKRSFKKVAPKRRAQKKVAPEKEVAVPQVSWSEPTKNEINAHHKTSHGTPDTEKLYVRSLRTRNVEKLQIIEQVEKDDEPALKKRSFKKVAPKRRAQKKVAPEKEVAVPQVSWSEPTKNEINAHHKTSHGTPDTEKLYVRSLRTRNVEKLQIIEQVEKDDEPALKKRSFKKVAPKRRAQKKVAPKKEVAVPQIIEEIEKGDEPALQKRSLKNVAPKKQTQRKVALKKKMALSQKTRQPKKNEPSPKKRQRKIIEPKKEVTVPQKTSQAKKQDKPTPNKKNNKENEPEPEPVVEFNSPPIKGVLKLTTSEEKHEKRVHFSPPHDEYMTRSGRTPKKPEKLTDGFELDLSTIFAGVKTKLPCKPAVHDQEQGSSAKTKAARKNKLIY